MEDSRRAGSNGRRPGTAPRPASAEGLFDFLFGGAQKQQHQAPAQANFFADPFSQQPAPAPTHAVASAGSGPAFCVRSCDGRYFPLARNNATPVQMCQAFCPASPTKVFFGSSIDNASSSTGERYADSENAYAYRKALRAMKIAEKFGRPIFTFIDIPGAWHGMGAEERGQAEAIARNLLEMSRLKVPTIATSELLGALAANQQVTVARRPP